MTYTGKYTPEDLLDLLDRLHDYMDNRADGDEDGPNVEMVFMAEIDEAITVFKQVLGGVQ